MMLVCIEFDSGFILCIGVGATVTQYASCHDNINVSFLINKVFQITFLKIALCKQRHPQHDS